MSYDEIANGKQESGITPITAVSPNEDIYFSHKVCPTHKEGAKRQALSMAHADG